MFRAHLVYINSMHAVQFRTGSPRIDGIFHSIIAISGLYWINEHINASIGKQANSC